MFRNDRWSGARVLVIGVEQPLATHLIHAMTASELAKVQCQPFTSVADCLEAVEALHPDVVFCSAQAGLHKQILVALAQRGLQVPVVVASRYPESAERLDALEAGALDYCAAPFEPAHIRRILENAVLALAVPAPAACGRA
jgi:DNA-binding NtrC family response regulator